MPGDLLLALEPPAEIAGSLASINRRAEVINDDDFARDMKVALSGMTGSQRTFEEIWQRIVSAVAKGETAEMQAVRSQLVRNFDKRLHLLKVIRDFAKLLRDAGRTDIPDSEILSPEIAGMERLKASVFDRWQSVDDLEELAARDYRLSPAALTRVAPHLRPAAWYAEDSKPF